jgi:hypothetical protein
MSRWSPSTLALPLLAVLVVLGLVVVPLSVGGDTHDDGETVFVVDLDASGDAHWQIIERTPLADAEDEAAFNTVAEAFEAGEYDLASPDSIRTAAELVDESTDRSMTVTEPSRTSAVEGTEGNLTGTLTVSFTWENFARMGDDSDDLYIDDVLETERGLWLPGLTADQKLVVRAPDGYAVLDASVPPQDGELHWEGPAEFDRGMLAATFVGNGNTDDTDDTDDSSDGNGTDDASDTTTDSTDDDTDDSGFGLLGFGIAGVAVVVLAALLVVFREQLRDLLGGSPEPDAGGSATDGGSATEASTGEMAAGADEPTPAADTDEAETGVADTDGAETGVAAASDDGIDEDLLSDEERVERLLERNGGRMKQADIVDETGWSNAKVSQLLSSMADENRVDKLRIGRENLISFPDVDVTDSQSDS